MTGPMEKMAVIGFYAGFHMCARWWQENTHWGRMFKIFCETWRTDSFIHLVFCGITVFIWGVVGIFTLAFTLQGLGL